MSVHASMNGNNVGASDSVNYVMEMKEHAWAMDANHVSCGCVPMNVIILIVDSTNTIRDVQANTEKKKI